MSESSSALPQTARAVTRSSHRSSRTSSKYHRRGELRHSWLSIFSVFMVIVALCVMLGLWSVDPLIAPGLTFLICLIGTLCAHFGMRGIVRSHGLIQGESHAKMGFWCHVVLGLMMFVIFSFRLLNGIVNGDLLF